MSINLKLLLTAESLFLNSLQALLHVLSGAAEYDELPVRHNEVTPFPFFLIRSLQGAVVP